MRRLLQRLLLPLAMVAVTQTPFVSAESIRLKGPNGEIQNAPQYAEPISSALRNSEPSRFYGPTLENETLWSIASKLRPSNAVTVQQTLYAIYQLNPQAFENQNIHELNPSSTIRVPSLNQISSVSTQEAVRILNAHQARLQQVNDTPSNVALSNSQPRPQANPSAAPVEKTPVPSVTPTESQKPEPPAVNTADLAQIAKEQKNAQDSAQKNLQASSESELVALEEKNHKLRLMLAQVQNEVEVLKDELDDESRIRNEVEKLLEAERLRLAEEQKNAPSAMDSLFSNTWLVAALAIIPGLLIGLFTVMLLGRRKKNEEQTEQAQPELEPQIAAPIAATALNNDLDDELDLDDDLFGESMDSDSSNKDEQAIELDDNEDDDIFAGLDDDLDFNLEDENGEDPFAGIGDDGDLDIDESLTDVDLSTSDISVNGKEKALGIEEMERALDEVALDEQSGEEAFELSDDGMMSQDDLDSLFSSESEDQEHESEPLQQAMLDELLSEVGGNESNNFDVDASLDDSEEDEFDLSDDSDHSLSEPKIASDEDIDDIFAQIEAQADLDALEATAAAETALLDELLEENTFELDENSTDLLDEFVEDSEPELQGESEEKAESSLFDELISVDEEPELTLDATEHSEDAMEPDSTFDLDAELDELIGTDNQESAVPVDSSELLDELIDAPEAQTVSEDFGDESTDLFEELLEIEKQNLEEPVREDQPENELTLDESHSGSSNDFSSEEFVDDMLTTAPQADALLDELVSSDNHTSEDELELADSESTIAESEESLILDEDDDWLSTVIDEVENPQMEEALDVEGEQTVLENASSLDDLEPESEPEVPQELEEDSDEDDWLTSAIEEVEHTEAVEDESTPELPDIEPALETVVPEEPQEIVQESAVREDSAHEDIAHENSIQENIAEQPLETTESHAQDIEQPTKATSPEAIPNEFGIPQDDDWLIEDSTDVANSVLEPELESAPAPETAEAPESEDAFNFDDLELPEYSEEDAMADMASEPELESAPAPETAETAESEDVFNFDELDFPEYSEEDAMADMASEPELESAPAPETAETVESEEAFNFDDLELPEYSEEDAMADMASEPELESAPAPETAEAPDSENAFNLDDLELPEYSEEDAMADMASEPGLEADSEPEIEEVNDSEEALSFAEEDLPEFSEQDALAELFNTNNLETGSAETETKQNPDALDSDLPVSSEHTSNVDVDNIDADYHHGEFDEKAFDELLSDQPANETPSFAFDKPLDETVSDSAGLDIEAMLEMGGEDWNGFALSPEQQAQISDDIPEEDQDIWSEGNPPAEAKVSDENWEDQKDIEDFNPRDHQYRTIDELMAEVEAEGEQEVDDTLQLDVGLNDFPDVIGNISSYDDSDANAEAAGKLDLAKIYMEMNDAMGARKLLEEAIVDGSDDIRREAKSLIDSIGQS